jgi:DNA-binding protein HU-beta
MNRKELIDHISKAAGISKNQAEAALNALLSTIIKALIKNGKINVFGLGGFTLVKRSARIGRNPQTGKSIDIKEKKTAKFRPAEQLSRAIECGGGTDFTGPRKQ